MKIVKPWTKEEDNKVREALDSGMSAWTVATTLSPGMDRTARSIDTRARKITSGLSK